MKLKILIILLSASFNLHAQYHSISGEVVDNQRDKLSHVYIELTSKVNPNLARYNSVSNEDGHFEIKSISPGEYILVASSIGYTTYQRAVTVSHKPVELVVELKEKAIELDDIIVTATRTERNLKNVPIPVQVISQKAIEKMQVKTMQDLLEYELPGVEFTNNGGHANINMLGFGGKYILFLIDGERMAGETFDNIDYNRIDMDNVEQIEIIKGASSSLYGSNAIGGVINIITQKPNHPFNIEASTRYGSHNEQNYNLGISSKQKWGSFSINGGYKSLDPILLKDRHPLKQEFENGTIIEQPLKETDIAGYKDYNISPKIRVNIGSKIKIEAKGGFYFKERNPGGAAGRKVRDQYYNYYGCIKGMYAISDNQHLSISANIDQYDKFDYFKLLNEDEKKYKNRQDRVGLLYDLMIAKKHSFVAGTEYFSEDLMTFMFENDGSNASRNAQTYSIFAQQDYAINKKLTLVGGLRFDYHSQFKGHLSPRISAMYKPTNSITIRGGYTGAFRSPTLKELYTNWFHPNGGGFQIIGNENMKAEVSNNFNIAAEASFGRTMITAMTQYSIIDNKIDNIWVNKDTTQYVNMGNVKLWSTEASVSHRFNESFFIKGTYAYVHDDLGKRSTIRPHTATFRTDYTSQFLKNYNPTLSFSAKFFSAMDTYGSQDITDTDNTTGISKDVSEEYKVHYNAYTICRLTLAQPLPYNFSLTAGINNLFDNKPKYFSFYSSISSGRTFYIGLKWKLR